MYSYFCFSGGVEGVVPVAVKVVQEALQTLEDVKGLLDWSYFTVLKKDVVNHKWAIYFSQPIVSFTVTPEHRVIDEFWGKVLL